MLETSCGRIGVRLLGSWKKCTDSVNAVDAVNEIPAAGVSAPAGTPGAGKQFKFKQIYDTSKSRNVLGIVYKDKTATSKDSIASFKAKGWIQ